MIKDTYELLKELLTEYPHFYYDGNCSILLSNAPVNIPNYHQVDIHNLALLDEGFSGVVDFHYSFGIQDNIKVFEIYFGNDPKGHTYFNKFEYLCMSPYGMLERVKEITKTYF